MTREGAPAIRRRLPAAPLPRSRSPSRPIASARHALVPGVLLTETMAQASGYLVLGLMDFTHMPFLMAVDKARFRIFVGPGTVLDITASLEHEGSGYAVTKARIAVGGKPICDAELRFKTMPFPPGLDARMRDQARRIGLIEEIAG